MPSTSRRELLLGAATAASMLQSSAVAQTAGTQRIVRFRRGSAEPSYGLHFGDSIQPVRGGLFDGLKPTGSKVKLADVRLLCPCAPPKVLAVGLNYKSHVGTRTPPSAPELFYKPITCLNDPGGEIRIPPDSKNTHYEGELVIVIGKTVRQATPQQAREAIFGVTCGNDVSERDWQNGAQKDLQWWRAKGADTFGPAGPAIVRGLDYGNLLLQTRLNGQVVQQQNTSDLLFDCNAIVVYASRYVTLTPGDIIYTGTPGSTKPMKNGDTVEVEIQGIGTLTNKVVQG
ncbi:MAG: fumarylacetoacetate hydrolase family protein [Bryobacteraceae bacterium]|nr:fumarylacetoacetate hydrolase family protein [Bryobacteraceae bacterium]